MPIRQPKILIFFLMTTVIAMSAGLILPNKNKAQATGIPVIDAAAVAELAIISGSVPASTAATAANASGGWMATVVGWGKDLARWLKEDALAALRDAIVMRIVNMMTDQVVQWIQGGGDPKFVTDWQGFLNDAFQAGVGDVISESNLKFLCSPFGFQLRVTLLSVPTFSKRITCTLDDIIANINDFYNDFRNGSWIAYEASWQPENNYYGALLMTIDEARTQGDKAKEAAQNESLAGKGFLSVKKCTAYAVDANDQLKQGKIKKLDQACTQWEIVTPGDTVGAVVDKAMGAQIDAIVNVKSVVSAIVNAAINRLIVEGLSLMKGSGGTTNGSYNIAPPEYQNIVNQELESQKQQMADEYLRFLANQQAILSNKQQSLSNTEQLIVVLNELKNRNCQPPISDAEITATQSDIDRLKIETAGLQKIVDEINTNINEINQISKNNRDREMALATNKYNQFLDKYDYLYGEIIRDENGFVDGGSREIARKETTDSQTKLSNAQTRLSLCLIAQATSTQP